MEIKAVKYAPEETTLEVEGITLLTAEEAKELPEGIRQYKAPWWLRTPGYDSDFAVYVGISGSVDEFGDCIDYNLIAVRPVLKIKELQGQSIGDFISVRGKRYVVISGNQVLYDDEVIYSQFDEDSNEYEESEIKQVVDRWLGEEVTRAHWKNEDPVWFDDDGYMWNTIICSECNSCFDVNEFAQRKYHYCPNCGAKMAERKE